MALIAVTPRIAIEEAEIEERFIAASGAGGQNVNKVATAVQLRFDIAGSPNLSEAVKARLSVLAGRRLTRDGVLVLTAQEHRTQDRNRSAARERLFDLIRQAAIAPVPRRPTRPTLGSKQRRLEAKSSRATIKRLRGTPVTE